MLRWLFNTRSVFSSFLILNNEDYRTIAAALADEYKAVSYMINVENWQDTMDFQNNILKAVISDNNGVIFTNWYNSATFEKTGVRRSIFPFVGNETKIARLWSLYPLSKLSSTTTQFEAFATYLMLMLFIAIVAFVSAVMVIGLKLISTIWDDAEVYNDLRRLGMKSKRIKELITKQICSFLLYSYCTWLYHWCFYDIPDYVGFWCYLHRQNNAVGGLCVRLGYD